MPTWTPKQFAAHLGKYTRSRRKDLKDAAYTVALRGVGEGADVANKLGIVDRGTYKQRFKARRTRLGAILRNDAPHAAVIEFGRRPGATPPPVDVIAKWVRRKLGIKGKGSRARIRQVAFLIARAIGRRGLPAHAVFRRHINPKLTIWFRAEIRKILAAKA